MTADDDPMNEQGMGGENEEEVEDALGSSWRQDEFAGILRRLENWDGDNVCSVITHLERAREIVRLYKYHGWSWRNDPEDELRYIVSELGTRSDLDWPRPWDEENCEFAYFVDRSGQYAAPDDDGEWKAVRWAPGDNCHFEISKEHS